MTETDSEEMRMLLEKFSSEDIEQKIEAAKELGRFDGEEVEQALREVLDHENFILQAAAEKSLERIEKRKKLKAVKKPEPENDEEAQVDLNLLTEEERQRIADEEIRKLEEEKRKKELEQRLLEEKLKQELAEKERAAQQAKIEAEKKKAETLLREKIRKEASTKMGLVEYEGEWLTREEMDRRLKEKEEAKKQAIARKLIRDERTQRAQIEDYQKMETLDLKIFSLAAAVFGVALVVLLAKNFVRFSSFTVAISYVVLLLSFLAMVLFAYLMFDLEMKIYGLRIIKIESEIHTFEVNEVKHFLLDLIRKAILKVNRDYRNLYGKGKE